MNIVTYREPEYMCQGCRGKMVLRKQRQALSPEQLASSRLVCSYDCAERVLQSEPGATLLMGSPSGELAALVLEMMGVSERGKPDYLRVISHKRFPREKWDRMAKLAKELTVER